MKRTMAAATCLAALWVVGGCNRVPVAATTVQASYATAESADQSMQSGDFAAAEQQYTSVINNGGVQADVMATLYLKRGLCYVEKGEFDGAFADFDKADQGSVSAAELHKARGQAFRKQGNPKKADEEFAAAKKLDPTISIPTP